VGAEPAAELARVFLLDVAAAVRTAELWHPVLFVDPPDAAGELAEFIAIADARAQVTGHISLRMLLGAAAEFSLEGCAPVILVGSDLPLLTPAHLHHALRVLRRAAVVSASAPDGAYSLIGMHWPAVALLDDPAIAWSGPDVLATLERLTRAAGLSYGLLPPLADVDTRADLEALRSQLRERGDGSPSVVHPRHTEEALARLEQAGRIRPG